MRRLAATALAVACLAVFAPIASAAPPPTLQGSDYVVLPGQTITFSNIILNSCNADQAGVNDVSFGTNDGNQCSAVSLPDRSITNDTGATQTYRLWLQDNSCSFIYFADGGHAKVMRSRAALNDAGENCSMLFADSIPKGKRANLSVSVSVG